MTETAEKTEDLFELGGKSFQSRLLMGTGRYPSHEHMRRCHEESGTQVVTLAVARHKLGGDVAGGNILDFIDRDKITLLPNTAGSYTAQEVLRQARLAREMLGTDWIKLEVLSDPTTLWPDSAATIEANRELVKEGFTVLAYTTDDPIVARRLEEDGAAAVMPLGSMIGSGQGILNPFNIEMIVKNAEVPVIVDAGLGAPSDVVQAMELGASGVLLNTAVSQAQDCVKMATAMRRACEAGRLGFLAGRIPRRSYAQASSPGAGLSGKGEE